MREFADFLGSHTPYSSLDASDIEKVAEQVEVEFFVAGTEIVRADGPRLRCVYVVRTGIVEVVDRGSVIDVLGPGDTFGHISVFSGLRPAFAVRCIEDTLCYRFPDPRELVDHPECLQFAHYGKTVARERLIAAGGSFTRLDRPLREVMRPLTWCDANMPVREVAALMRDDGASCAVYVVDDTPGIITDADFRNKVVTGEVSIDAPVAAIASFPALMVADDTTLDTAYITMVESGIHHLLASDRSGRAVGVARVVDIADTDVRNPLLVRSAAESARTTPDLVAASKQVLPTLVELVESGLPSRHVGALHAAMVEALYLRVVEMVTADSILDDVECSWLLLGSIGRRETLPDSDVDTALVWSTREETDHNDAQRSSAVVEAVMPIMKTMQLCGLTPCPQGLNAVNPEYNMSALSWRRQIAGWRQSPFAPEQLLRISTMADARAVTSPSLTLGLRREIVWGDNRQELNAAMNALAMNTRPPAGFVRGFVVERLGNRRGHLNLKKAGLRPIASMARALALRAGDTTGSTPERLDRAHRAGYITDDENDTLKNAFELIYGMTIDAQLTALRSGTAVSSNVSLDQINHLERRHLRDVFRAVSQIQERLLHYPLWANRR